MIGRKEGDVQVDRGIGNVEGKLRKSSTINHMYPLSTGLDIATLEILFRRISATYLGRQIGCAVNLYQSDPEDGERYFHLAACVYTTAHHTLVARGTADTIIGVGAVFWVAVQLAAAADSKSIVVYI